MNFSETDFLIIVTTFIILTVVLMMVLIYGIFIKKKSALLMSQQRQTAVFEQELAIAQIEIKEQTLLVRNFMMISVRNCLLHV